MRYFQNVFIGATCNASETWVWCKAFSWENNQNKIIRVLILHVRMGWKIDLLNILFHLFSFRSIVAIAIDLSTSEDRYFLWMTAVPLQRRCLQSWQHSVSRMRGVTLALRGPPNLGPESDHRYLILLLFCQPITYAKLYVPSVWSVVLVQSQLQSI